MLVRHQPRTLIGSTQAHLPLLEIGREPMVAFPYVGLRRIVHPRYAQSDNSVAKSSYAGSCTLASKLATTLPPPDESLLPANDTSLKNPQPLENLVRRGYSRVSDAAK